MDNNLKYMGIKNTIKSKTPIEFHNSLVSERNGYIMTLNNAIGCRIKQLCNENKISVYALAYKSGYEKSAIYSIINGRNSHPSIKTIAKICIAFDISLTEFFNTSEFESIEKENLFVDRTTAHDTNIF